MEHDRDVRPRNSRSPATPIRPTVMSGDSWMSPSGPRSPVVQAAAMCTSARTSITSLAPAVAAGDSRARHAVAAGPGPDRAGGCRSAPSPPQLSTPVRMDTETGPARSAGPVSHPGPPPSAPRRDRSRGAGPGAVARPLPPSASPCSIPPMTHRRLDELHHLQSLSEAGRWCRRASPSSTRRGSSPRANGSTCCSTRGRSSKSTASSPTAPPNSAWRAIVRPGDGVVAGLGPDRRPAGLRLCAGLHRAGWIAVGDQRRQDLQGDGPCRAERGADRRVERLRRRADPGGRRVARRLCRHLPAQHARVRRRAADLGDPRTVRRWRRLLAGDHRFHLHGPRTELHVRDRTRRGEDGDPRGRHEGRARRRRYPCGDLRRGAFRRTRPNPNRLHAIRTLLGYLPSNNVDDPPRPFRSTTPSTAARKRCSSWCPEQPSRRRTTCTKRCSSSSIAVRSSR